MIKHKNSIKICLIILLSILNMGAVFSQSRKDFIDTHKKFAVKEMKRTGIPASISLAQGILESNSGQSILATEGNNLFGIKCHDWTGKRMFMDDDEEDECFRKYKNVEHSWIDHSEFLLTRPRYANLFKLRRDDYKGWAYGLKKAGYATNPDYAEALIKIIEDERLYVYDKLSDRDVNPNFAYLDYENKEEMRNGIICIKAGEGDTFEKIAGYYGIKLKRLLDYNDKPSGEIIEGQMVYLKRKRRKAARGYEYHRLQSGESLYMVSQIYCIRLKNLVKYNNVTEYTRFRAGDKIYLRRKGY